MSKLGQLMEHSPYCERDIRGPQNLKTHDEKGDFIIKTKTKRKQNEQVNGSKLLTTMIQN